jgi:exodeoxyribonuclease X
VFLDTETTGKSVNDRVVQLAYYYCESNNIMDGEGCTMYVRPPVPIGFEAMSVHGITPEMVEEAASLKELLEHGISLQQLNCKQNYLVAHNASFDINMLKKDGFECEMQVIDTLNIMKMIYPEHESYKLQYLKYSLGLYRSADLMPWYYRGLLENHAASAHSAIWDVCDTVMLYAYLMSDIPLNTLVKASTEFIPQKILNFGKHKGQPIRKIFKESPDYLEWVLSQDFDQTTKKSVEYWKTHDDMPTLANMG